jgi:hypothetical protein
MKKGRGVSGRALFARHAITTAPGARAWRRHYRRPPRPKSTQKETTMEEQTAVMGPAATEAPPRPTLEELHTQKTTKEKQREEYTETLGAMWHKRQKGELPLEEYPRYMYLEDQLRMTFQQLERLEPQLRFAQAADNMTKAQEHWDAFCAPVAEQGLRVCQAWVTFLEHCAGLVHLIDEQVRPLQVLTRPDGQPAFHPDSGHVTLQNMLSVFPGQPNFLPASVIPYLKDEDRLKVGQTRPIMEHVKGKTPFEATNVQSYLAGFQYDEPKSMEDV